MTFPQAISVWAVRMKRSADCHCEGANPGQSRQQRDCFVVSLLAMTWWGTARPTRSLRMGTRAGPRPQYHHAGFPGGACHCCTVGQAIRVPRISVSRSVLQPAEKPVGARHGQCLKTHGTGGSVTRTLPHPNPLPRGEGTVRPLHKAPSPSGRGSG